MEILPTEAGLILTHRKFVKDLHDEFGNKDSTTVLCSLVFTQKLAADEEISLITQAFIGKLLERPIF